MRVNHGGALRGSLRVPGPFPAVAGLVAVFMVTACGPSAEYGPSVDEVARALPEVLAVPPVPPGLGTAREGSLPVPRGSSPRRIASVRMTEEARRLLRSGQYARALTKLERGLSTDGSNPYAHYYIALAHHRLGNFRASLDFLDAAEPILGHSLPWHVQSLVLRGDNLRALGRFRPAGAAYRRALSMDPANPSANRGLLWARQRSKVQSW